MKLNWKMIISGLLFLWSLAGLFAFYSQSTMSAESLAALPQAQQDIWAMMPTWVWADYGVAVGAGFVGAIGLMMRKAWATLAYLISLIAVLVQFGFTFLATPIMQTVGASAIPLPAMIIIIGALALVLARDWKAKGWIE